MNTLLPKYWWCTSAAPCSTKVWTGCRKCHNSNLNRIGNYDYAHAIQHRHPVPTGRKHTVV